MWLSRLLDLSALVYLHLPGDVGLSLSIGRQTFEEDASLDYTDTKIGITKALAGFEFELAYTDTNIPTEDCDGLDSWLEFAWKRLNPRSESAVSHWDERRIQKGFVIGIG
ncbi:MAG: hypothetical protein HKP12_14775 [Gammaproteobacteria bacterium]|nr:hypothetical protein [Gammaproteobacteria bacterium]